jgi:hypothetical protein
MTEIKILTPIGQLGYGFPEEDLKTGMEMNPDAIIMDGGSTDPGPYLLGTGATVVKSRGYYNDLGLVLKYVGDKKIPIIVSSAGGAGSGSQVDFVTKVVQDLCRQMNLKKKIVKVYGDIEKEEVRRKWKAGKVEPCSSAPELTERDIDTSEHIVAQMGMEPILKALKENPDADVFICGRAYDPSPYAAYCAYKGIKDSGIYWHMGKIMECGGFCCEHKTAILMATVRDDSFDLEPPEKNNRCTILSVASHTMYEKSRPDLLPGPGGVLDLNSATYEQISDKAVRVRGGKFIPSEHYQVKVEGASIEGYRSCWIGGVRDPILISQIDQLLGFVRSFLQPNYPELRDGTAKLFFHIYGKNAVMGPNEPNKDFVPNEIGILAEAVAPTQELADAICANSRVACLHGPYKGQLATGGNIAFPLTPMDMKLGPVCRFSIYHLMQVDDPTALFPYEVVKED